MVFTTNKDLRWQWDNLSQRKKVWINRATDREIELKQTNQFSTSMLTFRTYMLQQSTTETIRFTKTKPTLTCTTTTTTASTQQTPTPLSWNDQTILKIQHLKAWSHNILKRSILSAMLHSHTKTSPWCSRIWRSMKLNSKTNAFKSSNKSNLIRKWYLIKISLGQNSARLKFWIQTWFCKKIKPFCRCINAKRCQKVTATKMKCYWIQTTTQK